MYYPSLSSFSCLSLFSCSLFDFCWYSCIISIMPVVKAVESTSDCISQSKVGATTHLESDSFVSDQMHEFDSDVSASNVTQMT